MINRTATLSGPHEIDLYLPSVVTALEALHVGTAVLVCSGFSGKGDLEWQGIVTDLPSLTSALDHIKGSALELSSTAVYGLPFVING